MNGSENHNQQKNEIPIDCSLHQAGLFVGIASGVTTQSAVFNAVSLEDRIAELKEGLLDNMKHCER